MPMAQDAFNGSEVMIDAFYPVFENLLVRRKESAERTASGLYIADVAKEAPQDAHTHASSVLEKS
jgi:co-chaperonin GroES (HSP10)